MGKAVICILMVLCLTACGGSNQEESARGTVTLTLAVFEENAYLQKQVDAYNEEHQDCLIEIQKYTRSEQPQEDGVLKLQREIASGEGPDIIDFGNNYTTSDIAGEYTEDLFSYMSEEERYIYFENVMEAFSYHGSLYAVPLGFTVKSFAGTTKKLDGRDSWTIAEMMACYSGQKDERMLYPGETKKDVFGTILTGSMEYYIDWNTGKCDFDGQEFRDVLEFCNGFPDYLDITDGFSVKQTFLEDKALLLPVRLQSVYDICRTELIFDEQKITFIGFPGEEKCGAVLETCGPMLAISVNSGHKDAAWEFIAGCMEEDVQRELPSGFPVNRLVLQRQIDEAMEPDYITGEDGTKQAVAKRQVIFEGEEPVNIYSITEGQAKQLLTLIASAELSSSTDLRLYNIFLEETDGYFSGGKTLEETVKVIQARVSIYVNERIASML